MNRLLTLIFVSLLILTSNSATAQEYLAVNSPIYTEYNEPLIINNAPIISSKFDDIEFDNLAEQEIIKNKKFDIGETKEKLSELISTETDEINIAVNKMKFQRLGSAKSFSFSQVQNLQLKTSFIAENLKVSQDKKTFEAKLKPTNGNFIISVNGAYSTATKVPVLARSIIRGSQISQEDIELKNVTDNDIKAYDIIDVKEIINKTATKNLSKGQLVSTDDVRNPILVSKNSTVSAIYRSESVEVKALAVALQDGSEGDIIRLRNFDSGKTFKGVVQADGNILIGASLSKAIGSGTVNYIN